MSNKTNSYTEIQISNSKLTDLSNSTCSTTLSNSSKKINFADLNIPNHINSHEQLYHYSDLEFSSKSNEKNISSDTLIIIDNEINNFYNYYNSTIDKSYNSFIVFTSNYINNDLYEMDKIYNNCYSQYIDYIKFKYIYNELDGNGFIINDKKNVGHYQIYTKKYKKLNKNRFSIFSKKYNSNKNKINKIDVKKKEILTELYSYKNKNIKSSSIANKNNLLNNNIKPQNIKFNIGSNINIEINF